MRGLDRYFAFGFGVGGADEVGFGCEDAGCGTEGRGDEALLDCSVLIAVS